MSSGPKPFSIRLPATSANLGSGFDAAAVALNFFLEIEAEPAEAFSISATGQDSDSVLPARNTTWFSDIYSRILAENGKPVTPLAIRMDNDIPLGMGCGSSAAGRLAAIAMAVHFGELELVPGSHSGGGMRTGGASGQRSCLLAGWIRGCSKRGKGSSRGACQSASPLARNRGAPVGVAGDQQGPSCASGNLRQRRCRREHPGRLHARPGLCSGPGRSAARRNAGPDSPALSRRDVPASAKPASAGRNLRNPRSQL